MGLQMKERSSEFSSFGDVKIFCGTWNVNAKKPDPDEDLRIWLHKDSGDIPDVFCFGLQEIVDLTTVNVVADGKTKERSLVWCDELLKAIDTIGGGKYTLVHYKVN